MNTQLPIPSFEDIRKALQFWIDQQDKWFYSEGVAWQSGAIGETEVPNPLHSRTYTDLSTSRQTTHYIQSRIVGRIGDIIAYPPSLLLLDAQEFTANISYDRGLYASIVSAVARPKYGLVFTQITYYEPVADHDAFLASDPRVARPRPSRRSAEEEEL